MSGPRVPTCFVHVGTHKTGTTSLQMLLTENEGVLAEAGIHVPRAGRASPLPGHHNVAWELNADPRFDPSRGTLADLVEEIAAVGAPTACVSSEDFEYLHEKPDRLQHLAAAIRGAGYEVKVIIYLRPQAQYAASLYPTLLLFGLGADFREFVDAILRDGAFAYRGWTFRFEYSTLLEPFAEVFGPAGLIVRPYRPEAPEDALPREFLGIVSAGSAGFSFDRLQPVGRHNDRAAVLEDLRAVARQNVATDAGSGKAAAPEPGLPRLRLGTSLRMIRRFWRDNRRLRSRYGVRVPCVERRDLWRALEAAWTHNAKAAEA